MCIFCDVSAVLLPIPGLSTPSASSVIFGSSSVYALSACYVCVFRDSLHLLSRYYVCYLYFVYSVCIFCDSSAMPVNELSAPSMFSVFCGFSAICASFALSGSSIVFDSFIVCVLFTPSQFSTLCSLSAISAPSALSASSVACSIYILCDLSYLFLYCKSNLREFTLGNMQINQALCPPWLYHHLHPPL